MVATPSSPHQSRASSHDCQCNHTQRSWCKWHTCTVLMLYHQRRLPLQLLCWCNRIILLHCCQRLFQFVLKSWHKAARHTIATTNHDRVAYQRPCRFVAFGDRGECHVVDALTTYTTSIGYRWCCLPHHICDGRYQ